MRSYVISEFIKIVRYPYTGILILFSVLTAWVLIDGFFYDALEVFQLWSRGNPGKHFEDFTFISLKKQINLLIFLNVALLSVFSFYIDGQAHFLARRMTLPIRYTYFLLAKLLLVLGLSAIQLLLTSFILHDYLSDFSIYFTQKLYNYGGLLLDFALRLLVFMPLVLSVMILIVLTRMNMIVALLLALLLFYTASFGWLPFSTIHRLNLLIGSMSILEVVIPAISWSVFLFLFTKQLLKSKNY